MEGGEAAAIVVLRLHLTGCWPLPAGSTCRVWDGVKLVKAECVALKVTGCANAKVPFEASESVSVALSCRTSPVLPLARPVTTPLILKGPVLEPGPGFPPALVLLRLHPARKTEVIAKIARKRGFILGFISECRLLYFLAKRWLYNTQHFPVTPLDSNQLREALDSLSHGFEGWNRFTKSYSIKS